MPEKKRYKYCYHCGTPMEISDSYCPRCGAEAPPPPRFCIICGKQLAPNTKFCIRCGYEQPLPESVEDLEDLNNLKYIFVRDNAGLALYEQSLLTPDEFDADLLAGFTTAISNFSVELGKKGVRGLIFEEKKGTTSRMLAEVGEHVTVVAMMSYESRSVKRKLKLFLKRIEEECADLLKNWKGNVVEIREKIEPLVEEVFKVSRLKELEQKEKTSKPETAEIKEEQQASETITSQINSPTQQATETDNVEPQNANEKDTLPEDKEIRL